MNTKFGFFVKCPSMEMIEAIGISGCDFAVVDMEHTPLGPRDLYPLLLAAERRNLQMIVRIPKKSEEYFKWCRDLNVSAIQVPHIQSAKDVEYVIEHTMFAPYGNRGLCRFVRASNYSDMPKDEYLNESNLNNKVILQLEGKEAVKNINEIINTIIPGISLFIGPYDLSQSIGRPGEIWHDDVQQAMNMIINECKKFNIPIGTFTDTPAGLSKWRSMELDFVQYASDLNVFINAAKLLVKNNNE